MTSSITLAFETPPWGQGQIVTRSYATTPSGAVIEEQFDGSDRSLRYWWKKSGRRLTAAQLGRYGLVERTTRTSP